MLKSCKYAIYQLDLFKPVVVSFKVLHDHLVDAVLVGGVGAGVAH